MSTSVPYVKSLWFYVERHWLMWESLPAFLSVGHLILYTHKMDSNLYSCHVDALRELYISQALKPLYSSNTINSFSQNQNSSDRLLSQNGSKLRLHVCRKFTGGLIAIWFPQLKLNESLLDTGITILNPQIPLQQNKTRPNRIKGNNLQLVLHACGLNVWRRLWIK